MGSLSPQGLLVKNGSSCGEPQAHCNACGGSVAVSYGTAYYRLKADRALFEMAVRWPKVMRCGPQRGLSRWRRIRSVPGSIMSPATAAWSCFLCGTMCIAGMPTRRVMEFCAYQGGASAWRKDLLRDLRGRLGVGGVCAGVAPRVGVRDREAGPSQCGLALGTRRACHG